MEKFNNLVAMDPGPVTYQVGSLKRLLYGLYLKYAGHSSLTRILSEVPGGRLVTTVTAARGSQAKDGADAGNPNYALRFVVSQLPLILC